MDEEVLCARLGESHKTLLGKKFFFFHRQLSAAVSLPEGKGEREREATISVCRSLGGPLWYIKMSHVRVLIQLDHKNRNKGASLPGSHSRKGAFRRLRHSNRHDCP